MKIEYEIKGVTLDVYDLINIHEYYEAACSAEYIMDNYDITDDDIAIKLGAEVRRYMDKYGCDEDEGVETIMQFYNQGELLI